MSTEMDILGDEGCFSLSLKPVQPVDPRGLRTFRGPLRNCPQLSPPLCPQALLPELVAVAGADGRGLRLCSRVSLVHGPKAAPRPPRATVPC